MAKRKVRPHALRWGTELRKFRNQAGKTQSWLARQMTCSNGLVCGFEQGTHWPSKAMAAELDKLVQANGDLFGLWLRLSEKRAYPEWMSERVQAEPKATLVREFEPVGLSGLLQTEAYARTMLKAGNSFAASREIDELVEGRMRRQAIWEGPASPRMVAIYNEMVLTVPTGGARVMSDQLNRLIEMVEADTIRLHVIPADTEHHPFISSFTLLSFSDQPDALYVEDAVSGRMITEVEHVQRMDRVFSELLGVALSPEKSLKALYEYRRTFDHGT
ncbi:helix-turn-helix domain-containing protein [Nocardiopsis sp. EMB25]|uniref:helix-turn-helix domain-containing protein n=1 Tax=Nocardiopsis sp. EMB25 TaxID=2835867 RepID=UPI002285166F|nr:helix-turn-helix transcriptional regulator [Nocardiopsis sp. EMB25]MCY9783385.1 helix-turn-helix domain-containing protein [Nocardiopsis sp. EMB25]